MSSTSRIILNEVIDVVAEYVRKENTQSLEDENAFFSIMADEVTDPQGKQEITSVCCKVKEFFFYFIYLERATVEAIAHAVIECLKDHNITRVRAMLVRNVCPRIRLACRRG